MFKCQRCGWCCRNIVINIAYSDITRWFNEGRDDILNEVSFIDNYPRPNTGGFYIAKTAFNPKQPCPFLADNLCKIYETRPVTCKDYPYARDIKTVTAEKCAMCPEPHFIFDRKKRREITKRQYRDFKMAHDNRYQLLKILVEVRENGYSSTLGQ